MLRCICFTAATRRISRRRRRIFKRLQRLPASLGVRVRCAKRLVKDRRSAPEQSAGIVTLPLLPKRHRKPLENASRVGVA
jgi:hypothetical protein